MSDKAELISALASQYDGMTMREAIEATNQRLKDSVAVLAAKNETIRQVRNQNDDLTAMLKALTEEAEAERDLLIRFIAVDDQRGNDEVDITLLRKLAAEGRELLWIKS